MKNIVIQKYAVILFRNVYSERNEDSGKRRSVQGKKLAMVMFLISKVYSFMIFWIEEKVTNLHLTLYDGK